MRHGMNSGHASALALLMAASALTSEAAHAQAPAATSLTIYSSARPGSVPPELYRPVLGHGAYTGQSVPGYAMIRQTNRIALERGSNRFSLTDVAAHIDPTTVRFESLTDPATRVLEQAFQFDLVNDQKLMERYTDQVITVEQQTPSGPVEFTGRLLSSSFFEFHLYTLGRPTSIPDNSTKQIELFPELARVPARKRLVYHGSVPRYGYGSKPMTDRDLGLPMNTKVDVYLDFTNDEASGIGMPLPAGRVRVSQLDEADGSLELIGEDVLDHTPRDEEVPIKLGSAFDVVGNRRQVEFELDIGARRIDEVIETAVRNHKTGPVEVIVRETLYRWATNTITEASSDYERLDNRTIHFPVTVEADGEAVVRYRVRYSW